NPWRIDLHHRHPTRRRLQPPQCSRRRSRRQTFRRTRQRHPPGHRIIQSFQQPFPNDRTRRQSHHPRRLQRQPVLHVLRDRKLRPHGASSTRQPLRHHQRCPLQSHPPQSHSARFRPGKLHSPDLRLRPQDPHSRRHGRTRSRKSQRTPRHRRSHRQISLAPCRPRRRRLRK